jgi:hypothetical protein
MNEREHKTTSVEEAKELAPAQVQIACRTNKQIRLVTDAKAIELAQRLETDRWYLIPFCPDCESEKECLIRRTASGFDGLLDDLRFSAFSSTVH